MSSKGRLQNSKPGKTWETIPTGERGSRILPGFPNLQKIPNLRGGGLGRLGWFPKFFPVLSSEVSPKNY